MTRRILTTLVLLTLTVAVSAGLLHAQGSPEAEQPSYRIDILPGWNLISFPGNPADPALENVMGDSQADVVLAYQDNRWSAAVRKTGGGWRTTSEFTAMSGGMGYWVHATAEDVIEMRLSSSEPDALPINIIRGWNLVGVWDAQQRPPGTEIDADDYFSETWWRVAYGFLTDESLWTKLLPDNNGTVVTGAGYWMWNTSPSSCSPYPKPFDATKNQWDTPTHRRAGATVEVSAGYRTGVMGGLATSCP